MVGALACADGGHATDATLTVEEALARALTHNAELAHARHPVAIRDLDVAAAEMAFDLRVRPTVGYTARRNEAFVSYGVTAERAFRTGTTAGAAITHSEGRLATGDPFAVNRVSIELRQPLFRDAGSESTTADLAAATDAWRRSARSYEHLRADIAIRVIRQFAAVQRLRNQVDLTRQAVRRTRLHHRATRAQESSGRRRRLDSMQADMLRVEAEGRLANELAALASAERELAVLLGAPIDAQFDLAPLDDPAYPLADNEEAVAVALANRLDYAQALDDLSSAERDGRLTRRNRYPDLSLYLRFQRFTDSLSAPELAAFGGTGLSVGLTGGFDATTAERRVADIRSDRTVDAAAAALELTAVRITLEVRAGLDAYRNARARADDAARRMETAQHRAELARRLYLARRTDADAVATAEAALTAAETQWLAARTDAVVLAHVLARDMGTLLDAPEGLRQ